MRCLKTIVVDDEEIARAYLAEILGRQADVEILAVLSDANAVIERLEAESADLVFADIGMPGMNGIALVERLMQFEDPPSIAFTTAHGEYALTAFELGAVDYLVKPFGEKRVIRTLERIRAQRTTEAPTTSLDRIQKTLSQSDQDLKRIYVRGSFGVRQIHVDDISHFSGEDDYVMAHVQGTGYLVSVRLKALEERLPSDRFTRVHRSHIVNLSHLIEFKCLPNGTMEASLKDGVIVPVSRRYAGVVRRIAK